MIRRLAPPTLFQFPPVVVLLLRFTEAGGDPGIFCYRMGVDIFSAGSARLRRPLPVAAPRAGRKRNNAACSNLFSTFSARFSTLKD
jgi:hypothetical protein